MSMSKLQWSVGRVDPDAARAKVQAAQANPALALVPSFPEIIANTSVVSPLLPIRMTSALVRADIRTLAGMSGWTFTDFLMDGLGAASISETIYILDVLASLSPGRLARLSTATPAVVPNLPIHVIASLARAKSVDHEIIGLLADLDERNRALILARWGYDADGIRTLEDVGSAFGITRERARQIVTAKEKQLGASGVRLPLATEVVNDLDEAGGALPDPDYRVLLRYGQISISASAVAMLPELSTLRLVPEIGFDSASHLWVTRNGRRRVSGPGDAGQLAAVARVRTARYLRRLGAVPISVLDDLSPFGRQHALSLLGGDRNAFEIRGDHALRLPLRDSALLRQCRKALVATGELAMEELLHGLRRSGFAVTRSLLEGVLDRCADFVMHEQFVCLAPTSPQTGVLSPAESRGRQLLGEHGGVMSWWDFVDAMTLSGFSAPMAAVVLKKPWIKRLGPSTYGLRGRVYDQSTIMRLHGRKRRLTGRRVIRRKNVTESGEICATYDLNRFALQGVLPVPGELRAAAGAWTARFADGRATTIKVSKGFMWPLQAFMNRTHLKPGDRLDVRFDPTERTVQIEIVDRMPHQDRAKPMSREQQILRALFGKDI